MILDEFVPEFAFRERHSIQIEAPPGRVFEVLTNLTPAQVPFSRFLMGIRALPAILIQREPYGGNDRTPFLRKPERFGFILLGEEPEREIVVGVVGRFWRPTGGICRELTSPLEFTGFHTPGYVKAGWNFVIEKRESSCVLRTETRISPTDAAARLRFGFYWTIVRPGSGILRRAILRTVKRLAEKTSQ